MDKRTLEAYDLLAAELAQAYESYSVPSLRSLVTRYFVPQSATADIGCGSGRDAAWMRAQGFAVTAYDDSDAMLAQARALHPDVTFRKATLPALVEIPDSDKYSNVLCTAVLMHIPAEHTRGACARLLRLLKHDGVLVVSVRCSNSATEREPDGRLFTRLSPEGLERIFADLSATVVHSEFSEDEHRAGVSWRTLVLVGKSA